MDREPYKCITSIRLQMTALSTSGGTGNVGLARFNADGTLDTAFDADGVTASYRDGILTIALPLTNAAKARLVPVQAS